MTTPSPTGPEPTRTFGEGELLCLAGVVWAAIVLAVDTPSAVVWGVGAFAVVAAGERRRWFVAAAIVLFASSAGASAEAAYQLASPESLTEEPASLVTDTEPSDFGWRAEARLDATGQRVRLIGTGFVTPDLVAGQPVRLDGRMGPADGTDWDKSRHIVAVVSGAEISPVGEIAWFRRPGEWLRRGVLGATASFDPDHAALYHGLVIGDDRFQGRGQQAQFRAAGLSHLLAVSGQNVAFMLAILAPLTSRVRPGLALVLVVCFLVVFALATRLEPSVLRATMTAGVSTLAAARSARSAGVRSLSIAVIVLLLIDPFLARSVGFQLSVAASVGILLLSPLIRSRLSWPEWIANPVAITLAAQIGVSPILLVTFGPIAAATIPANLLAGWAAGAVMTLGLSVGLVASVLPEPLAAVIQLPSRWLVWWIDAVAAEASVAPLPAVSLAFLPWMMVGSVAIWWLRPSRWHPLWWAVPLAIVMISAAGRPADLDGWFPASTTTPSVLVIEEPSGPWVEAVVASRIRTIDVIIVADGGWTTARTIDRLRDVVDIGVVLAPGDHRIVGGRRVLEHQSIAISTGRIDLAPESSRLEIDVVVAGPVDDG